MSAVPKDVQELAAQIARKAHEICHDEEPGTISRIARYIEMSLADRLARAPVPAKAGEVERLRELVDPDGKKGPPQPVLYPNAEWCEAYSKWHRRAVRMFMAASPSQPDQRAIKEAREDWLDDIFMQASLQSSFRSLLASDWLEERGAMLPADRQRARSGQAETKGGAK